MDHLYWSVLFLTWSSQDILVYADYLLKLILFWANWALMMRLSGIEIWTLLQLLIKKNKFFREAFGIKNTHIRTIVPAFSKTLLKYIQYDWIKRYLQLLNINWLQSTETVRIIFWLKCQNIVITGLTMMLMQSLWQKYNFYDQSMFFFFNSTPKEVKEGGRE